MGMHYYRNHANGLRPEIHQIFRTVGLASHYSEILRIAAVAIDDGESAIRDLRVIDKMIPGLGLHNFAIKTEMQGFTVVWKNGDRPIFRPIYYVSTFLQNGSLEWQTRSIVTMSCLHVENSLKRQLKVDGPHSVGMILRRSEARSLDAELVDVLRELNEAVYNKSKHSIELTDTEGHMFSIADSLAVYLICRTLGSRILKQSGITTEYDEPVFDEDTPVPSREFAT